MADAKYVKVDGLRELEELMLDILPAKVAQKALVSALKKAGEKMYRAARSNAAASDGSKSLAAAMGKWENKKAAKKSRYAASVQIGPKRNSLRALKIYYAYYKDKRPTSQTFKRGIMHGHLVEFGRTGQPAKPFLQPAFMSTATDTVADFGTILGREIEKAAAKHGRKTSAK